MESALLFIEGYKNKRIIDELEAIKAEVKEHIIFRDKLGMDFVCEPIVEEIIDKRIDELKGENNESKESN